MTRQLSANAIPALSCAFLCALFLLLSQAQAAQLFTDEQARVEAMVEKLISSPEVGKIRRELRRRYEADPAAQTTAGKRTMEEAIEELAVAGAIGAANSDPDRPMFIWSLTPEIIWSRYKKLAGRWAADNPDNIHHFAPVSGKNRYVVRMRPTGPEPVQFSLMLGDTYIGEDTKQDSYLDTPIAYLMDIDLVREADGSFLVTVDNQFADGRANHIQTSGDARILFFRQTLSNWNT